MVREVQALPLISANMAGGSGLNRMYTFHTNVMYVYVQASRFFFFLFIFSFFFSGLGRGAFDGVR